MQWRSVKEARCSVARALSVVGERWTMLILREAFLGHRRFDEFQAATGIARNILSTRLQALVAKGIFERNDDGPERHVEYRLTEKGLDLYPVLISLMRWGDTWMAGEEGPPLTLVHRECGHSTKPALTCSHCHGAIEVRAMQAIVAPHSAPAKRHHRERANQRRSS
ncbi:MAG TPA: helix-turn-helix domain-containing protein [Candidatus Binataceae bacterium]|jgi:DNA-binding HxlR family transcriptional regulator|nr:helix-turn-helix domain-containing protein [Candidatus Binataceae bacterium]